MSVETLLADLNAGDDFDVAITRQKILKEFDAAATADDRSRVLAVFKAVMDATERSLIAKNETELLDNFRAAREQDYKILIVQECTVGLTSPGGGDVSVERMKAVTNREIAAGRMTEQHSLRQIAVQGAAVPHPSDAELVEKHRRLQQPPTFGQKLKGLLKK